MASLSLYAVTAPGLEALTTAELAELGIIAVPERGGASWQGPLSDVYAANLHLRTASRIVVRVGMSFHARTFFELERRARRLPWERFLVPGRSVRLRVTCRKSRLYHEGAVAERLHAAMAERVGVPTAAKAPQGDPVGPDDRRREGDETQLLIVRCYRDECTVSVDASGAHLHRRGYRQAVTRAPLRETLAAAMVRAAGWDGRAPLADPLCGTGTIAIEAALLARRIPPGLAHPEHQPRAYAFQGWPEFDMVAWQRLVDRARESILPTSPAPILASDRDAGAIDAARDNARRGGVLGDLQLAIRPLSALQPHHGPGWLVTNPPYGVRVGNRRALRDLYASLGNLARRRLPGWTLGVLSADRRLDGQIGIPWQERFRTRNGGIGVRFVVGRPSRSQGEGVGEGESESG